ncbi:MAG TPA: hypothetical protein VGK36_08900 [Candidatus Angelobacter sp.]|jgi:hypothetical protein
MKQITRALVSFVAVLSIIALVTMLNGCSARKPVRVTSVPHYAHFDPAQCRYLPDGIRFRCKDVVFDPKQIDAKGKP